MHKAAAAFPISRKARSPVVLVRALYGSTAVTTQNEAGTITLGPFS